MLSWKTRGVTIVSVIIGTALSAFLITIMLQIFSSSRATYKMVENLSALNDTSKFAQNILTRIIKQAGYMNPQANGLLPDRLTTFPSFTINNKGPIEGNFDPATYPNSDDPAGVYLSYYPGENIILSDLESDKGDRLWVKFQGNSEGKIRDCVNFFGEDDTTIMIKFYSRAINPGRSNSVGYFCERVDNNSDASFTTPGQMIIPPEHFDSVMVRYGEDYAGRGYIERWAAGEHVQHRSRVKAVRVALLLHTKDDVRSTEATQTFHVFGETITRTSKKIYKLNMFTVLLPHAKQTPSYSRQFLDISGNFNLTNQQKNDNCGGENLNANGGVLKDTYRPCTASGCPNVASNGSVEEDINGYLWYNNRMVFKAARRLVENTGVYMCNTQYNSASVTTGQPIIMAASPSDPDELRISSNGYLVTNTCVSNDLAQIYNPYTQNPTISLPGGNSCPSVYGWGSNACPTECARPQGVFSLGWAYHYLGLFSCPSDICVITKNLYYYDYLFGD